MEQLEVIDEDFLISQLARKQANKLSTSQAKKQACQELINTAPVAARFVIVSLFSINVVVS